MRRYKAKRNRETRVHVSDSLMREKIWSIERCDVINEPDQICLCISRRGVVVSVIGSSSISPYTYKYKYSSKSKTSKKD
jgi:hypothetical protein